MQKCPLTLTTSLFVSMILEHVDLAFFHSFIFIWHRAIFKRPACNNNRIINYYQTAELIQFKNVLTSPTASLFSIKSFKNRGSMNIEVRNEVKSAENLTLTDSLSSWWWMSELKFIETINFLWNQLQTKKSVKYCLFVCLIPG